MRVLVTGAAGFLGSWLVDRLAEAGHTAVGFDSLISGVIANCRLCEVGDCCDLEAVTRACEDCDAVYHCAALAYEGLSVFSPSIVVNNIVTGSVTVMTAAIRCGVKRFVNCSSMARYGDRDPPFYENMHPNPVDPYGMAKYHAERQLNLLGRIHGVKVVHAVPHNIYGPRQRYTDPYRNVAAIFANRMLQDLPVYIYGDGQQTRCFSYIDDVLPTMVQLLEAGEHGEVFNVGPDRGEVTVLELFRLIAQQTVYRWEPVFLPGRPQEVKYATCSSDKIRRQFGFEQRTDLRDGIAKLVNWIDEQGPRPFDYHLPLEIVNDRTPMTWKERL